MFYAAKNTYASDTSIGFYNTWYVMGFGSRTARDEYVRQASDLATRAILQKEVKKYGGLSVVKDPDGKTWRVTPWGEWYEI